MMFDVNKLRRRAALISSALLLSLIACVNFGWAQEAPRPEGSSPIKPPMIKPPMHRSRNANSGSANSSRTRRRRTTRRRRVVRRSAVKAPSVENSPTLAMPEQGATPGPANAGSSVADVSGGISGTGASGPGNIKPPMANNGSSAPLMSPPEQQGKTVAGGILNGKAISLPKPPYPAIARSARASGTVVVQVIVNEQGDVMSAHAISGHPLLQSSAVQAAWAAKFTPTRVDGQPVKVSGKITYNFVL